MTSSSSFQLQLLCCYGNFWTAHDLARYGSFHYVYGALDINNKHSADAAWDMAEIMTGITVTRALNNIIGYIHGTKFMNTVLILANNRIPDIVTVEDKNIFNFEQVSTVYSN